MYYKIPEEELRNTCKVAIENLEKWSRLVIDKEMTEKYGKNYFYASENGRPIIKKAIIEKVEKMMKENTNRFPRIIDTLF